MTFKTEDGPVYAVRGVDLAVHESEVLGVVGESGSGKSVTMLAAMGLLPKSATITGSVKFRGQELLGLEPGDARHYRGSKIAMIFQDPLTALNPVLQVGDQIAESRSSLIRICRRTRRTQRRSSSSTRSASRSPRLAPRSTRTSSRAACASGR